MACDVFVIPGPDHIAQLSQDLIERKGFSTWGWKMCVMRRAERERERERDLLGNRISENGNLASRFD